MAHKNTTKVAAIGVILFIAGLVVDITGGNGMLSGMLAMFGVMTVITSATAFVSVLAVKWSYS